MAPLNHKPYKSMLSQEDQADQALDAIPSNPEAVVESMLRNPKVAELKLTKAQLEGVLAALGESVREVFYCGVEAPGDPGYAKYVIGGWLEVQANSTMKPLVTYTPGFVTKAASEAKKSGKAGVKKFNTAFEAKYPHLCK
jgi:hypothetical protein